MLPRNRPAIHDGATNFPARNLPVVTGVSTLENQGASSLEIGLTDSGIVVRAPVSFSTA